MKKHIGLALGFCLSLTFLSVSSVSSAAPQIVGTKCVKAGTFRSIKGAKYKCKKSSKGLRWVFTPTTSTTSTTTSPTTTAAPRDLSIDSRITRALSLAPADNCKISDLTPGVVSSGFPRHPQLASSQRSLTLLAVPTVFSDLGFSDNDLSNLSEYLARASSYFESVSYGKVSLNWKIASREDWLILSDPAEPHNRGVPTRFREWIAKTSPRLNINNYDVVFLQGGTNGMGETKTIRDYVSNIGVGAAFLDPVSPVATPSGQVKFGWITAGRSAFGWAGIVHEGAHAWLGFEDLYTNGTYPGPFGQWDIMNRTGGKGTELSVWNRFLAGWVDDSQIRCIPRGAESTVHFVSSLTARNSFPKGVIYSFAEGKALVVESRRPGGFDSAGSFLVVYVVDTSYASGIGPFRLVRELSSIGDKATFSNIVVELLDSNKDGDLVIVTVEE